MKKRQNQIVKYILSHSNVTLDEIVEKFAISQRTVYYDIDEINFEIRNIGKLVRNNKVYSFIGDFEKLNTILKVNNIEIYDIEKRKDYILYRILCVPNITIDNLIEELNVSKNTIVSTIDRIKKELSQKSVYIKYEFNQYNISGNEKKIRETFILLMQEDNDIINVINQDIMLFNDKNDLQLSDYSLGFLSKYYVFMKIRINSKNTLKKIEGLEDVQESYLYKKVDDFFVNLPLFEKIYLTAYIQTLPRLKSEVNILQIDNYVENLIRDFEKNTAVEIQDKDSFKKNITRHLCSSYYRIKYAFPIYNPLLEDIKIKNKYLFNLIKKIIKHNPVYRDFKKIRDEEVAFLCLYFATYISNVNINRHMKTLLVCPNGLMISRILEMQIKDVVPNIEIVDCVSIREFEKYDKPFDFVISTVEIISSKEVIVVNPILTKSDIKTLVSKAVNLADMSYINQFNDTHLASVIEVIKKYCKITDYDNLIKALDDLLFIKNRKENPMLKELLTKNRIQKKHHVDDWKEAIRLAAKPLLEDGSITEDYINSMYESVETHGPYIVLTDYFAMPHATSAFDSVKRLAMSMLVLDEEVDLLGKPVKIFVVLAPIDTKSHMRALSNLSELLYEKENMDLLLSGDLDKIVDMIQKGKEDE